ncbi:MAG: helix-turn-helix domain-containing protein [Propionibacteriaceae bacterium]|jgi:excisionase family DNA binding protein|nr:helix-turn-helix domain-containing protein [Propionibacteriaceae bacterium]
MRTLDDPSELEPLMSTAELAAYLGVPATTLYDWRINGQGPVAYRIGKHLRFRLPDVLSWLDAHKEPYPVQALPRRAQEAIR